MTRPLSAALALATALGLAAGTARAQTQPAAKGAAPAPKAEQSPQELRQKASYAIGVNIGTNMKRQGVDLDPDQISQGLKDALAGKPAMTEQQMMEVVQAFQKVAAADMQTKATQAAEKSKKDGEAFLAANKAKPGVTTLADGLQYKVIKQGTGPVPKATDEVRVHYTGTLIDGTKFDSSVDRKEPAEFPVGGVIKGWTEALQLMKVGSKYQLFIPSELAYGANPRPGGPIKPNDVLIFDVELLGIKGK